MFQPEAADESDSDRPADGGAASPETVDDELQGTARVEQADAAEEAADADAAGESSSEAAAAADAEAAAEEDDSNAGDAIAEAVKDPDADGEGVPFQQPSSAAPVMLEAITVEPDAAEDAEAGSGRAAEQDGEAAGKGDGEPEGAPGTAPPPVATGRDAALGAATAEGLSTMTPVARVTEAPHRVLGETVLSVSGLSKQFGTEFAVKDVDLEVRRGSFTGIVGPNGAGKTTTISMATGLLRPTSGAVEVLGINVWEDATAARRHIGILPDRLRLFDQLTGAQLLYYTGVLRGLTADEARSRTESLLHAFGLEADANRLVVDYSAGMTKKAALASALIHSPELLVLDEPFESIDPVSASQLTDILFEYVQRGGSVLLSSHSMDLVQRVCDHVAVIVRGGIVASGTVDEVRGDVTLEERFRAIVRGPDRTEGLDWLGISFS